LTRPRRLAFWLYVIGIVQMFVLLTPALVFMGPPPDERRIDATAATAVELLRAAGDRDEVVRGALRKLRKEQRLEVSVYGPDGRLIATNVEPALRAPTNPRDAANWASVHFDWLGAPSLLVARLPRVPHTGIAPPLLNFLCGFVVIAVGAFITGHWLVQPLHRLANAARAIGGGDLRARADAARNDEIGAVAAAFNEMAERVQGLLLAEKELLANVSHELRTPLARIRVALHLATEGDPEASRASLCEIAIDLEELEAMIDDILMATRVAMLGGPINAAAGFSLHLQDVEPAAVGERAVARFRLRHASRPLQVSIGERLPIVRADAVLLRRVLDNLLENAHKYSPNGDAPIALRLTADGKAVVYEVIDQGTGIAPEDLPKLFDPFFRSEAARLTTGIGLGLTLVKRVVDAHAGSIAVSSTVGRGTQVRVSLPCGDPQALTRVAELA
jgi:two-component system, OmpR family, sensor kinase